MLGFRKAINQITLAAFLAGSLFFLNPAAAGEHSFALKGKRYNINVNEKTKTYSIAPEATEENEKELLGLALTAELKEKVSADIKKLEEKVKVFAIDNPSKVNFETEESMPTIAENTKVFSPYNYPRVNIKTEKKGRDLKISFKLDSQDYVIRWGKENEMAVFFPKGTKVGKPDLKVFEWDITKKDRFENFSVKELPGAVTREVYGKLADKVIEKLVKQAAKNYPPAQAVTMGWRVEDWLAKQEKKYRKNVVKEFTSGYKSFEFSPTTTLASDYEIGREISLSILEGYPEQIYFFIGANATFNPLKIERGTSTRTEGSLLQMISLKPTELKDDTPAGKVINGLKKELKKGLPDDLKKTPSNFEELRKRYSDLEDIEQGTKNITYFLDRNIKREITQKMLNEFSPSNPINPKTLEQAIAEYRTDYYGALKKFVKTQYKISESDIKSISQLDIDGDQVKEYSVIFKKRHGSLAFEESEYDSTNSSIYLFNSFIEKTNTGFSEKGFVMSLPESILLGTKHRDYNKDGKEEMIIKSSSENYPYYMICFWDGEIKDAYGSLSPSMNDPYFHNLLKNYFNSEKSTMTSKEWRYILDNSSEFQGD